ncbi:MAG: sel1 repeat family protein [Hyphomicrobiales bacterium]
MARFEVNEVSLAAMGMQSAPGDVFFQLGMMYSTGRSVSTDLVEAHKWFNLAAAKGNHEAARYRQEVAAEMSSGDIAAAQREAREWLRTH